MTEAASGPGADLHKSLQAFDLEPAFSLGEVVFYNTKNFFKKHNFGRDVKRFVHQNDWCIYNNKYHLNARGIITLGFSKKNQVVLDLVWKTLCLPPCDINLQPNQYGNQDENAGDIQFKTEPMEGGDQEDDDQDEPEDEAIEVEHEPEPGKPTKKASAAATTNLPLPIKNFQSVLARDSPRSIGSFESPRSPSGHGTPTAAGGQVHPSLLKQLQQQQTFQQAQSSPTSMQQAFNQTMLMQMAGLNPSSMNPFAQYQLPPMQMQAFLQQQQPTQSQQQPQSQQMQQLQNRGLQPQPQQQIMNPNLLPLTQKMAQIGGTFDPNYAQFFQSFPQASMAQQTSGPHVGQKRAMPSEFGGEQRTTAPVPPGQRFPGILPLDLSGIQRIDGAGTGSSDRSGGDASIERNQNFFMMMPDDIVGNPGDFSRQEMASYPQMFGDFNLGHDQNLAIDSPVDPSRRQPFQ